MIRSQDVFEGTPDQLVLRTLRPGPVGGGVRRLARTTGGVLEEA